ncbi:MAG: MBL fold metallo-hydrolase [Deltaproteobacteria bacterium]|nr:MBL fold metallo-hydrolase [Deltaproteobacteria bacterium]
MKLIILGCGTSTGVPLIGCRCPVCASKDPKNKRTRSSLLIQTGEGGNSLAANILIDTSTDLRFQALAFNLNCVDAVLFTHPHADHIHGIDDLRSFNLAQTSAVGGNPPVEGNLLVEVNPPIPCYANQRTVERIKVMAGYIFKDDAEDGWKPNLTLEAVDGPFMAGGAEVIPIEINHGASSILGYRIGDAAYLTDCSAIPDASLKLLKGVKILIVGALRHEPHPTHFTVAQAVEASRAVAPQRTILTHLSHSLDYAVDNAKLPKGVELAYDGMTVEV